jgi:glycosyltransferase involved in cell wall biosynthesis
MARVLLVSKPISPPWNDSSKNLVRDLATHMQRHRPTVLSKTGVENAVPGVKADAIYPANVRPFAPALADNLRVVRRLLTGERADLWHFFFAPNPRSSLSASWASKVRRVRTLQTICSAPRHDVDLKTVLFADRLVVLSKFTEQRLLDAGVQAEKVRLIPPCVPQMAPLGEIERSQTKERFKLPLDRPLLVYPGDLEFSSGAEKALFALADLPPNQPAHLALACRGKTPLARQHESRLKTLVAELGLASSVTWIGETQEIVELLGSAEIVLLPAENLYAKMDLPLALIEAMAMKRPVVVTAGTPAQELAEGGAALAVESSREATSAAVLSLLNDSRECIALGERAGKAAQERYGAQSMASAYEKVYDELLG